MASIQGWGRETWGSGAWSELLNKGIEFEFLSGIVVNANHDGNR